MAIDARQLAHFPVCYHAAMTRVLRTLMLWCLLLALPLQGFAAATMLPCAATDGPTHGHATATTALADANYDHHHALQDIAAAHDDGQGSQDHAAAPDHQAGSKCSTCAVCCVGAAFLPANLNVHPVFHSLTLQLAPAALLFSGTSPQRLERPPRPILA